MWRNLRGVCQAMSSSSQFDDLLGECWRHLARSSAPRGGGTIVELALSRDPIDILGLGDYFELPTWNLPVPIIPEPEPEIPVSAVAVQVRVVSPKLQLTCARAHPSEEDAVNRSAALAAWVHLLSILKGSTSVFVTLRGYLSDDAIAPYLATRRTSTLMIRASAIRLFLKWAEEQGHDVEDFDERLAFVYLQHLRDVSAPPTRPGSFLKACNFCHFLLGLSHGNEIALSARCRGLAAISLSQKRRRVQRDPLRMAWVIAAEEEVVLADHEAGRFTQQEACVMGFLLFCLHTRSRVSDAARICDEPTLDLADGPGRELASFIEAVTTGDAMKTGNVAKKARLEMPVVGLAMGISGRAWAPAWLVQRAQCGLNAKADSCLMREPLSDGTFAEARIQPGHATQWLRHLLIKLGVDPDELRNVGSHSCKTTLLSVAAKGGLPRDDRRTLGGHATPGDSSVDCYSRDVLAAPLLSLAQLIEHVREKRFDPDASRSGRWSVLSLRGVSEGPRQCKSCVAPLTSGKIFLCECGCFVHASDQCSRSCQECAADFCLDCVWFDSHACTSAHAAAHILAEESDDSVDTEHDTDGELASMELAEAEDSFIEAHAKLRFLEKGVARGDDAAVPDAGVFFNRVTRTAHQLHIDDPSKSACGMKMSALTYEFASGSFALDGCSLCWRSGCSNWEAVAVPSIPPSTPQAMLAADYTPTSVVPEDFVDEFALALDEDGF